MQTNNWISATIELPDKILVDNGNNYEYASDVVIICIINKKYVGDSNEKDYYRVTVGYLLATDWYLLNQPLSNEYVVIKWQWMPIP